MKNTFNLSKIFLYILLFLLPIFIILFLAGGCSFKYTDLQYYEFKGLCSSKAKKLVLHRKIFETTKVNEIKSINYHNEKINSRITKISFENIYKNKIVYYEYETYLYDNYGIFLKGDEAAGWHWENSEILDCKPETSYQGD